MRCCRETWGYVPQEAAGAENNCYRCQLEYFSKFVCVEVKRLCERTLPVVCAERTLSRLRLISAFINGTRPASYGGLAVIITNAELALRQEYDELIRDFAASKCLLWLMKSPPSHSFIAFCDFSLGFVPLIWPFPSSVFNWFEKSTLFLIISFGFRVEKHLSVFVSFRFGNLYWYNFFQWMELAWSHPPPPLFHLYCSAPTAGPTIRPGCVSAFPPHTHTNAPSELSFRLTQLSSLPRCFEDVLLLMFLGPCDIFSGVEIACCRTWKEGKKYL